MDLIHGDDRLVVAYGDDRLVVAPEQGAAILEWTRRGMHLLLRPLPGGVAGRPGGTGCVPLVPFCNRIAWRRFSWAGRTYELAANFGTHPHAIHGIGWQRPWRVAEVSDDTVTLTLHHDARGGCARGWPFAFTSRLIYRLSAAGLTIQIEATSLHPEPAPMGIGAHPWFPRDAGATVAFQAKDVWLTREDLPLTHTRVPPEWEHAEGRTVDREKLDNCFTGWNGEARLPHLRITADPVLSNLQIFTPAAVNFFCVEPVSHIPDAINHNGLTSDQSMAVLSEGETLSASMMFVPDSDIGSFEWDAS
jgi:aldose 1-epimerase